MNSGVQDAVSTLPPPLSRSPFEPSLNYQINLAWKLALVEKKLSPARILESYTEERVPVIASMLQKTTELFKKTFEASTAVSMAKGRHRGHELRQFGVNYRKSSIVVDERYTYTEEDTVDPYRSGDDGTVRAGDRAPDAPQLAQLSPVAQTTMLFDIFSPAYHTVLIFASSDHGGAEDIIAGVQNGSPKTVFRTVLVLPQSSSAPATSSADIIIVDMEGFAYKHYAIADDNLLTVVIVRPDGFIGGFVSGADGVRKYLGTVFC